jgi:RHS repeat-associated protein
LYSGYNYKYNGKEYQDELGLNMYDYGARNYDPAIGRFNRIDRFAEKYHEFTPYSYAGNNPVIFVDVQGDSLFVGQQYRNGVNKILEQSFGANASKFSYSKNGGLVFNGKTKDLSKNERAAFKELNKLMTSSTSYEMMIEENVEITKTDGTKAIVNTGQSGTMGDAAIYPSVTIDGRGILALNPDSPSIQVPVLDVKYDANGNQLPANFADMDINGGRGPNRSFSMYENFWHGIGHLVGGPGKDGRAMEVENLGGKIRKNVSNDASGTKNYVPASIAVKAYNMNHPKD